MSDHPYVSAAEYRSRVVHYKREPRSLRNLNELHDERRTAGMRIADAFAELMGSWPFIIVMTLLLAVWIGLNVVAWMKHWDPYPFILLNLALSFQSAYAGPIIMMSQNRQSAKDRLHAQQDYEINQKAEREIETLMLRLEHQHEAILTILERLEHAEQRAAFGDPSAPHVSAPIANAGAPDTLGRSLQGQEE